MTDSSNLSKIDVAVNLAVQKEHKKNESIINQSNPEYQFDMLRLYFGEDYHVTDDIVIHQPTIGDIIEYGEDYVYSIVSIFVSNTTSYRLTLWDMGIDWNKISDFELFASLISGLEVEKTRLLFGDLDWSKFTKASMVLEDGTNSPMLLYNEDQDIFVTEEIYLHIRAYIRKMFNINPKVEKAKGKTTKQWMIDEDRQKREREKIERAKNPYSNNSTLFPMISACINHPGFKYKTSELKEVGIIEFMDSVQRLQIYENTRALIQGSYSGFCDTSKIDKNQFNFMREIK